MQNRHRLRQDTRVTPFKVKVGVGRQNLQDVLFLPTLYGLSVYYGLVVPLGHGLFTQVVKRGRRYWCHSAGPLRGLLLCLVQRRPVAQEAVPRLH